jgi:hypothetical protein
LREVKVLFVAGKAVKKEHDGVRPGSLGDIREGVEHGSVAGDLEGLDYGWINLVRCGICGDGRGKLLGREMKRDTQERSGGDEAMEAHGLIVIGAVRIVK